MLDQEGIVAEVILPDGFIEKTRDFVNTFLGRLKEYETLLTKNKIWMMRTKGVGVISAEDAINYGLSGPCIRGSGVRWDVRKSEPYSSYDEMDFLVPVGENGDVYDRYLVRLEEMRQSNEITRQAMDNLPKGEYIADIPDVALPKKEDLKQSIAEITKKRGLAGDIWLMPIIESDRGVVNVYDIADAADNVAAIAIGLEDFTADLGTGRTEEGLESFFSRSKLVIACKAAGIQAIDSVYSDVSDMEGLKQTVLRSKALGFNGMGCIHPRQIEVIHEYYAPNEKEIEKAKRIYNAFIEAREKGLGVVSLGTKMIDAPVVKRAENTINLAVAMGKLSKNWRDEA